MILTQRMPAKISSRLKENLRDFSGESIFSNMTKAQSYKKGTYYRLKTKKWFKEKGYFCEYLEKTQRIYTKGKVIFIKRDIAGADGLAMNEKEIIFWQAKLNTANIASAIKEFHKFPYPDIVQRWIVVWTSRVREPQIVEVT